MKKIFIAATAALTTLVACQKNELAAPAADSVLYATIEETDATKTYMDATNNIRWSEGDQIVGFMKSSLGLQYEIVPSGVGRTFAHFEQVHGNGGGLDAGIEWDHNVVYYPYASTIEAARSGSNYVLDVLLPSKQTYAAESFGNGAMAMVAISEDSNIVFRNVLGGMKLQLKGTQKVKSITLQGNNDEKLSGAAIVTAYADETKPAITMASDASNIVTLNCSNSVRLNESTATEFIISLPPVLFSKGFKVTVTDAYGRTYTIETDKTNTVLRSSILVMPEIEIDEPAAREGDYVDEYGINYGSGVKIGETVWAPVNCGYHETDYKYGKLYQWGRKYGHGYSGDLYDGGLNIIGECADATVPTIEEGPVALEYGQAEGNSNIFFTSAYRFRYDWLSTQDDKLWNSGTESAPVKTAYDPCPDGWRVPTYSELSILSNKKSLWTKNDGQNGYWFSGASDIEYDVPTEEDAKVFFPATGGRSDHKKGGADFRGSVGNYWSSRPGGNYVFFLIFGSGIVMTYDDGGRCMAYSVRCVQE